MLFNSFHFFAFFSVVLILNHLLRRREGLRRWMLLIASAYFYGQWSWFYLILIYTTVIVDFTVGRHIYRRLHPRGALFVSLAVNLGILSFFKYGNFLGSNIAHNLVWLGIETQWSGLDFLLPVGISFYTFQSLSYTLDLYRRELEPRRSLRDYALFVTFSPNWLPAPLSGPANFSGNWTTSCMYPAGVCRWGSA